MKELDPLRVELEGTQLIEASAGTGKTYTITTLVLRLLLERRLPIEKILVVTFTNAATAELRERVRRRIREAADAFEARARGEVVKDQLLAALVDGSPDPSVALSLLLEALRGVDEAAISTIHGFCQRVLAEHAFESHVRFDMELVQDQTPLISELVEDFWGSRLAGASEARLRFLATSKVGLDSFRRLARLAVKWPEMPVVPPAPAADPDAAVQAYVEARARALEAWDADRVEALLSEGLDGRSYRRTWVEKWCHELDLVLREPGAVVDAFKMLDRFTPAKLEEAAKAEPPRHPFFSRAGELLAARESAGRELSSWWLALQHEFVDYARSELSRRKQERGVQSFDDLLQGLAGALDRPEGEALAARIRSRLPAALIDEFQDTDPVQYRIFHKLYSGRGSSLLLIGDPKQAIYAFRGADVFAYLGAVRDAGERVHTLATNYRSDPGLIRAVNTLFSRPHSPFLLDGIGFSPVRARPEARDELAPPRPALGILFVPRAGRSGKKKDKIVSDWYQHKLPRVVAADIARLLAERPALAGRALGPGDIAVLTRINAQAREIQAALAALRIPAVLHGESSVLDSLEAEELGHVMAAMADPPDPRRLRAALTTHLFGLGAEELFRLGEHEDELDRWIGRFVGWNEEWKGAGFVQAFHRMLREAKVSARLLALVDGERRLTNVLHLAELLHRAATGGHLGIAGLVAWFDEVREDEEARRGLVPASAQIRLESDRDAVQLTTMHKSKGLEYAVVYCPYLWASTELRRGAREHLCFHDPEDGLRLKLDLRSKEEKADRIEQANQEALAEGLRLAYVALTRAKHRAVMVWGAFNGGENCPLAWLLHQPGDAGPHFSAKQRVHLGDDRALRADLAELVEASDGAIEVCDVDESPAQPHEPDGVAAPELEARRAARLLDRGYRNSSFSALAATAGVPLPVPAAEGRDRDELALATALPPAPPAPDGERVLLHDFPRGAKPGDLLHGILEQLDFQSRDEAEIARLVGSLLGRHGFDAARWTPLLVEALGSIVDTPLAAGKPLALREVAPAARRSEMEFVFPVAPSGARFTANALAEELSRHGTSLPRGYADRVRRLGFAPLSGFLRGFIDLVFEYDGRFYLVDYKSNHLGDHPGDYRPERLVEAMAHHHYYLQYHLYAVALHRHLGLRLPGYDYERHFGGVRYLFLRGMSPAHAQGHGVFSDVPPRALVEGLSALLAAPGHAEARP